jgi:hypothetical protein
MDDREDDAGRTEWVTGHPFVSITVFRLTDVFHVPAVVFLTIAGPTVLLVLPNNRRRLGSFMLRPTRRSFQEGRQDHHNHRQNLTKRTQNDFPSRFDWSVQGVILCGTFPTRSELREAAKSSRRS